MKSVLMNKIIRVRQKDRHSNVCLQRILSFLYNADSKYFWQRTTWFKIKCTCIRRIYIISPNHSYYTKMFKYFNRVQYIPGNSVAGLFRIPITIDNVILYTPVIKIKLIAYRQNNQKLELNVKVVGTRYWIHCVFRVVIRH